MSPKIKNRQQICLQNQQGECEKIFHSLTDYLKTHKIDTGIQDDLRLALEETFINIISYAYPDTSRSDTLMDSNLHNITVEFSHDESSVYIRFIDDGIAFNPLSDAAPFNADKALDEGGMGIHLLCSLTDAQFYQRSERTNVFTLTKHYTSTEKGD